jgi:hypothetical protein
MISKPYFELISFKTFVKNVSGKVFFPPDISDFHDIWAMAQGRGYH